MTNFALLQQQMPQYNGRDPRHWQLKGDRQLVTARKSRRQVDWAYQELAHEVVFDLKSGLRRLRRAMLHQLQCHPEKLLGVG